MSTGVTYPDVQVKLVGKDGNAFMIIGEVMKAIRAKHGNAKATAYADSAMDCDSYDDLIRYTMRTVVVS